MIKKLVMKKQTPPKIQSVRKKTKKNISEDIKFSKMSKKITSF
jgi:hypothetical protein